jgi:two-component system sensor histidine kinase FlrB
LADGGACFTLCLPTFDASQSSHQVIVSTHNTQPQQYFVDAAGS